MKVNGLNNGFKAYSINKLNKKEATEKIKNVDRIEISSIAKKLTDFSNDYKGIDREQKVNMIKNSLDRGTYTIDARKLSQKLLGYMGEH